jgi:hypothetical protein
MTDFTESLTSAATNGFWPVFCNARLSASRTSPALTTTLVSIVAERRTVTSNSLSAGLVSLLGFGLDGVDGFFFPAFVSGSISSRSSYLMPTTTVPSSTCGNRFGKIRKLALGYSTKPMVPKSFFAPLACPIVRTRFSFMAFWSAGLASGLVHSVMVTGWPHCLTNSIKRTVFAIYILFFRPRSVPRQRVCNGWNFWNWVTKRIVGLILVRENVAELQFQLPQHGFELI